MKYILYISHGAVGFEEEYRYELGNSDHIVATLIVQHIRKMIERSESLENLSIKVERGSVE